VPEQVGDFAFLELMLTSGANVDQSRKLVRSGETASTPLFEAVCEGEVRDLEQHRYCLFASLK